jgi:hypothetical protein
MRWRLAAVVAAGLAPLISAAPGGSNFSVVHSWFCTSSAAGAGAGAGGASCIPNRVKVAPSGQMYATMRRPSDVDGHGCSTPFGIVTPEWEIAPLDLGEWAPASVTGFELDACGRMWLLDQASRALLIYDVSSGGGGGGRPKPRLLRRHAFPPAVAPPASAYLADISLDIVGGVAYIADAGCSANASAWTDPGAPALAPGIIVYDASADASWRVLDRDPSVLPAPGFWPSAVGARISNTSAAQVGVYSVAVSADARTLAFGALSSPVLYGVPTAALRASRGQPPGALSAAVTQLASTTSSVSSAVAYGTDGALYLADPTASGLARLFPQWEWLEHIVSGAGGGGQIVRAAPACSHSLPAAATTSAAAAAAAAG